VSFHPYQSCTACSGGPKPGTVAVMRALIVKYPYIRSMGIYSCRDVRGGSSLSIHSCGRAGDPGIPTLSNGQANTSLGHPVIRDLSDLAGPLGIMGLIYDRVRYDARSPKGRYYGGVHPHYDHVHFEQRDHESRTLTDSAALSILGVSNQEETMKRGDKGRHVAELQHALAEGWGQDMGTWTPHAGRSHYTGKNFGPGQDGDYGGTTETRVKAVQKLIGLPESGITDGVTASLIFAKLGGSSATVDLSGYSKTTHHHDGRYLKSVTGNK
jgi:hypothetical protein